MPFTSGLLDEINLKTIEILTRDAAVREIDKEMEISNVKPAST